MSEVVLHVSCLEGLSALLIEFVRGMRFKV